MKHDQVVRKKYRDAGLIVAICTVLVVLLAGVYLINNGNGRDLSDFSNTNSRSDVDYDLQSSSVLKVVNGGSSTTPAAALFEAIRIVESGGDDYAVGDDGKSKGPYQISQEYFLDATEHGQVDWIYDEVVWSDPCCRQLMLWYWERHGAETNESRARMHIAGPDGPQQECSLPYWKKIKQIMELGNE